MWGCGINIIVRSTITRVKLSFGNDIDSHGAIVARGDYYETSRL
jgi:hypothetical protein